jgi:tRNA U34 5-carboxymethylaminomethyl modifying enzyme MnmG/GidA
MASKELIRKVLLRISGISYEERVMLNQVRPESLGQARRIEGVSRSPFL